MPKKNSPGFSRVPLAHVMRKIGAKHQPDEADSPPGAKKPAAKKAAKDRKRI